jgi:hypothetical protein
MFDRKKEGAAFPEGIPRLKTVKAEARTISEAIEKTKGGAGQTELNWVMDPANYAEAKRMLRGNHGYFFPNALGALASYVVDGGDQFWLGAWSPGFTWDSADCVVV